MLKILLNKLSYKLGFYVLLAMITIAIVRSVSNNNQVTKDLLKPTLEQVSTYVNEKNQLTSKIIQKEANIEALSSTLDSIVKVNKQLKIQAKNIKQIEKITQSVDTIIIDTSRIIFTEKDTIYTVSKIDPWLYVTASVSRDTGTIKLSLRDTLSRVQITKKHLLRPTENFITITHSSPYFKTDKAYSFVIKEKSPLITIGPYVGYGYDGTNFRPSIGVSVQYPLIKLR